ncbi:MAG TPA: cysteine desulfurase family protein [Bacteroidales bacterium]|nr:cysteine desulfurase family protein [Bacteroidales bacterium]
MKPPVYLDYSATTPCDPRVVDAMLPYFTENFGNPASRFHLYGWEAEEAVDTARSQVARLIGAKPSGIIFTGGATEACNLAIRGVIESFAVNRKHIITLSTEHKAVLETFRRMEAKGCEITMLGVNKTGMPDPDELERAIRPYTVLIAVMYANNETGVIPPVRDIASIARRHNVLFFSDATQAVGKIPVDVATDGPDMMAFTAHKMYGPKGVGALYIRGKSPAITIVAQLTGGYHERGIRSGTLNVPGIAGFGKAAQLAQLEMETESLRVVDQRNILEKKLLGLPGIYLNGDGANRLPHITNISIERVESEQLLLDVSSKLALGTGSACSSATHEPSHVLKAMGVPADLLPCSLRISQGRFTTREQIDFATETLTEAIVRLRTGKSGIPSNHLRPSSFSVLPE